MGLEIIYNDGKGTTNQKLESDLMVVYVQDYGDDYHRTEDQPSTELERKIRNLRRKYKNVMEYNDAMTVYIEYMELLKNKYGDGKIFKIYKKNKFIHERIPPKPKLRSNKLNKFILEHGILISTGKVDYHAMCDNEEWFDEIIDDMNENVNIDDDEVIEVEHGGKELDKFIDKAMNTRLMNKHRLRSSDLDYMEEYFGIKNINSNKKKTQNVSSTTITELILQEDEDYDNDDIDTSDNGIVEYAGRYFTKDTIKVIDFYKTTEAFGWDPQKLIRKRSGAKGITKLFKEEKKKKKKLKKDVNGFMSNILSDGNSRYIDSFESYEKEMLDFTSNLFK